MEQITPKNHGLLPLPFDHRDFSHDAVYGTLGAGQLPYKPFTIYDSFIYTVKGGDTLNAICAQFGVNIDDIKKGNPSIKNPDLIYVGQTLIIPALPIKILNQFDTDFCTAFASTAMDYALKGKSFDPLYRMAKIKQYRGSWKDYGANLRDAAVVAINTGALPIEQAPFTHNMNVNPIPTDRPRDFLANWTNYPQALDAIAAKYKDASFFTCDGPLSTFDNIISALSFYIKERRIVNMGVVWRPEWTGSVGGVIKDSGYTDVQGEGHSTDFIGVKMIDGIPYLVNQGSWGTEYGDKGLFYFPASIINKEFKRGYGCYVYTKMPKATAQYYVDNGIKVGDSWVLQFYKVLETMFIGLFNRFKKKNGQ